MSSLVPCAGDHESSPDLHEFADAKVLHENRMALVQSPSAQFLISAMYTQKMLFDEKPHGSDAGCHQVLP